MTMVSLGSGERAHLHAAPVFTIEPDADFEWLDERTLVAGSPLRRVTFPRSAAGRLRDLLAGAPMAPQERPAVLRLVRDGVVHPCPAAVSCESVTVVVPFHGDPAPLRTLLRDLPGGVQVIVVDDASPYPPPTDSRTRVLHHDHNRGPAAARNTGWQAATTPFVAFLDADTVARGAWCERLLAHLHIDDTLAAVAPRIRAQADDRLLSRYELVHNPLDMGPRPALVRRHSRVPYVPSAALVVRRSALDAVGGFDESLRLGEDVDLLWRLGRRGWAVRYDPAAQVRHHARPSWAAAWRQRHAYGRSSAALWQRHPDRFRHLEVPPTALLPLAGGVTAGVRGALLGALAATVASQGRAHMRGLTHARWSLVGQVRVGAHVGQYLRRVALPVVVYTAWRGFTPARRALALALAPYLVDRRRAISGLSPATYVALRLADDLAYLSGAWRGAMETHTLQPLAPTLLRRRSAHLRLP